MREIEVAIHIATGKSYKWMAEHSFTAESTIRRHAANIWKKSYVTNRKDFLKEYPQITKNFALDPKLNELDKNLAKVVNLSWEDNNLFEEYFEDFSEMIRAMFQMDFSKRLEETNDKNSLFYFIAKSLNILNEELQTKFDDLHRNQKSE